MVDQEWRGGSGVLTLTDAATRRARPAFSNPPPMMERPQASLQTLSLDYKQTRRSDIDRQKMQKNKKENNLSWLKMNGGLFAFHFRRRWPFRTDSLVHMHLNVKKREKTLEQYHPISLLPISNSGVCWKRTESLCAIRLFFSNTSFNPCKFTLEENK